MSQALRLFIGIDVGDAWTDRLSSAADALRDDLGRSVRWVRPELYHVTVVFLGNQPPEAVADFTALIEEAASRVAPFELRLVDLGPIGRHEHGALVARIDDPSGQLQRFRTELDRGLSQLGVTCGTRRFESYVTPLTVEQITLVKSDLLPTGPRYETIATAQLGSRRS